MREGGEGKELRSGWGGGVMFGDGRGGMGVGKRRRGLLGGGVVGKARGRGWERGSEGRTGHGERRK